MEKNTPIGVYIKVDYNSNVISVGSEIFITDFWNWVKIDEGFGDKYAHAQSQYFDKPLFDENGNPNYKYQNGKIAHNTY